MRIGKILEKHFDKELKYSPNLKFEHFRKPKIEESKDQLEQSVNNIPNSSVATNNHQAAHEDTPSATIKKKKEKKKKKREIIEIDDESDDEKQELFKNITLHLTNDQKKGIIPIVMEQMS